VANWCANRLIARGDPAGLASLRAAVRGVDEDGRKLALDFDRVAPTPREVNDSPPPVSAQAGELLDDYFATTADEQPHFARQNPVVIQMVTGLMTGKSRDEVCRWNAQTWREVHWGTKWTPSSDGISIVEDEADHWVVDFDTAWSPPIPVVRTLAERFPGLELVLMYSEPDSDLAGYIRCVDGRLCDHAAPGSVYEIVSLFRNRGWVAEADWWLASIGEDVDE
jgi:hypothetical protein